MRLSKGSISPSANIVKSAVILGDVSVGEESCILFHAVIRGDEEKITIGNYSNIQDNCTVHADKGFPAVIGDSVTVGHNAVIHGCTIGEGTVIGMGAIVLNGAQIGKECLIGAGSVVLQGQKICDGCLAVGNPAKVKRLLTPKERSHLYESSRSYAETGKKLREAGYTQNQTVPGEV